MLDLLPPLAVVCHDAGAANIILAWLRAVPGIECRAVMQGPAATLWKRSFPNAPLETDIDAALRGAAVVLTGTGWASDLEHRARVRAAQLGIPSIAVLDHWVNYPERFSRAGTTQLPDEIWVTDGYAKERAEAGFPGRHVQLRENLYLLAELAKIADVENSAPNEVLYALEPARSDWGRGVPGEFQALDFFADRMERVGLPVDSLIRLRPHPSDRPGKYDAWMQRRATLRTVLDDSADLSQAFSRVRWVAGCESFALVIALNAGRNVICTLPPWAPPCRLPHRGLIHLKDVA